MSSRALQSVVNAMIAQGVVTNEADADKMLKRLIKAAQVTLGMQFDPEVSFEPLRRRDGEAYLMFNLGEFGNKDQAAMRKPKRRDISGTSDFKADKRHEHELTSEERAERAYARAGHLEEMFEQKGIDVEKANLSVGDGRWRHMVGIKITDIAKFRPGPMAEAAMRDGHDDKDRGFGTHL